MEGLKISLYFISFELFLWSFGKDILWDFRHAIHYSKEYGGVIQYFRDHVSIIEIILSIVFLILAIYCFKRFIELVIYEVNN